MLGHTQPALPRDAPPPTSARSSTTTSAPRLWSSQAQESPTTPPPITATRATVMWRSVLPVDEPGLSLADALSENRMKREVGGVPARRDAAAQPLGHRADVMG